MADAEWVENIKRIVLKAVESGDPCDVISGTVTGISPLSVRLDQKTTLSGPQLILSANVTDHVLEMEIPGKGLTRVTIKAGLTEGENVLLLQKRGGQQYVILDRYS